MSKIDPAMPPEFQKQEASEKKAETPETPETENVETKPETTEPDKSEPPKAKKVDANGDPSPDHPRFKQIYGKLKETERTNQELAEQTKALREWNAELDKKLAELQSRNALNNAPDPTADPKAYAEFMRDMTRGEVEAARKLEERKANKLPPARNTYDDAIAAMEAKYPDYNDVVRTVEAEINSDEQLKETIFSSPNPPMAAYFYGINKKKTASAEQRKSTLEKGYVEGGSTPPSTKGKIVLDDAQKKMARALGIPEDRYLAQLKATKGGM